VLSRLIIDSMANLRERPRRCSAPSPIGPIIILPELIGDHFERVSICNAPEYVEWWLCPWRHYRRGSTVVTYLRLWVARWRGAPDLPFVGKFSMMRVRRVALASARYMTCCESALSMGRYLVALSTARGEGLSRRKPQSGSSMVRQRRAFGQSSPCGKVNFWQGDSK